MSKNESLLLTTLLCSYIATTNACANEKKRFTHDWTIENQNSKIPHHVIPPTHIQVKLVEIPPARAVDPPRTIVKMYARNGKLVFSSKERELSEPIYITAIEKGNIAIVWRGPGPNFGIDVYTYYRGKIMVALRTGSRLYPEIVYPTQAIKVATIGKNTSKKIPVPMIPRIITSTTNDWLDHMVIPESVYVWTWDEHNRIYKSGDLIPWDKRFLPEMDLAKPN